MPVSDATYERVALEDAEHRWELARGRLRERPEMTTDHGLIGRRLILRIGVQLGERDFSVGDNARLRVGTGRYYVPDVAVVPVVLVQQRRKQFPTALEIYDAPMPLVIEIWSPSTGDYDLEEKLGEYQRRSDLEIWHVHPIYHVLIAWRRQVDGTYTMTEYRSGIVQPAALPSLTVDLDTLFA